MDILKLIDSVTHGRNGKGRDAETWLIACLGNPGREYEGTRHNAGFSAADVIAEENGCRFRTSRGSLESVFFLDGKRIVLIKPQTYMNRSGEAVAAAAKFYGIVPEHIIVIYDDINLEPGVLRIRRSGSAGGHNGMKSIISCVGTDGFPRIRIGVGAKPDAGADLAAHVLGRPGSEDREKISGAVRRAAKAFPMVMAGKIDEAQSLYCREK